MRLIWEFLNKTGALKSLETAAYSKVLMFTLWWNADLFLKVKSLLFLEILDQWLLCHRANISFPQFVWMSIMQFNYFPFNYWNELMKSFNLILNNFFLLISVVTKLYQTHIQYLYSYTWPIFSHLSKTYFRMYQ